MFLLVLQFVFYSCPIARVKMYPMFALLVLRISRRCHARERLCCLFYRGLRTTSHDGLRMPAVGFHARCPVLARAVAVPLPLVHGRRLLSRLARTIASGGATKPDQLRSTRHLKEVPRPAFFFLP